jgi:hypothetical protein
MERKTFESEQYGVSFSLPAEMTVREQLGFRSRIFLNELDDFYSKYWLGALPLLEDWKCDVIPDPNEVDLDKETDKRITNIVNWVCNTVAGHVEGIEDVPPNS